MVNTNPTHSVANSHNPVQVAQPQPSEGEVASGPATAEPAAKAKAEAASGSFPATGAGNPEPSSSAPKFSRRVWRSGEPYHPKLANHDGDHWKRVYERAEQFDNEFCNGWNSEIDALLTFAGLFSAVVTAFTIESYKWLQPDPQDMTNRILLNVSAQLAGGNATELPSGFIPSSSSLRINVLWFLSLTFSLTAGLVGILCKQWLRHYQQGISKPPKEALVFRQFRYDAFLRCRVVEILSALPVLLGLGLILFFIGLIDFLQGLDVKVSIPVTILIGFGFAFLVITTSAPAFQYIAALRIGLRNRWNIDHLPLFAFKSPQSLAILHLITWLCPLSSKLKLPNWASLELRFFSYSSMLKTYTGRTFTWLDETYSHSLDIAGQICLCLQDVEDILMVGDMDKDGLKGFARERSSAAVIESLFEPGSESKKVVGYVRRDIIAMRYLFPFTGSSSDNFNQCFTLFEYSMRALNSSHHPIPSLGEFEWIFSHLPTLTPGHPVEQLQELIWQRAILVRNLLSQGRWMDSTKIPGEVQSVFKDLDIFSDEDLNSIFDVLRAWMDHSQHTDLPSHCWVTLVSKLEPHELNDALRHRPPARDFMAFLDSRFRMGDGVAYLCNTYFPEEAFGPFFMALYAWIGRNPQDTQSFTHCRTLMTTMNPRKLGWMRHYLRDFEAFLEAQIEGDVVEQTSSGWAGTTKTKTDSVARDTDGPSQTP